MNDNPLISCICITNNRPLLLERAIANFYGQVYPNKELIISYPVGDDQTKLILDHVLKQELEMTIIAIERDVEEKLGSARNTAIRKCNGDYVCIWDDDDWYHPERLSIQYNSMKNIGSGCQASVLTNILLYDSTTQKAYLSFPYTWDGTLLCRKEILYQNQYSFLNKAEDSHIIKFLDSKKLLHYINDYPFLYIYIYHGQNTWDYTHYEYFLKKSTLLDQETTKIIQDRMA